MAASPRVGDPLPAVYSRLYTCNECEVDLRKFVRSATGVNCGVCSMPATRAKAAKPGKIIKKPPTTEVTVIDEGDVALPATVGSASKVSNEDRKKWQWKGASIPTAKRATK